MAILEERRMNILITGGFGNIGTSVVEECLGRGHGVTVFDVRNKRTEKLAKRYRARGVQVEFGDLRKSDDVEAAAAGQDAAIHLAAILPPASDAHPKLCDEVNRGGTANLVAALAKGGRKPALVEVSSASVMGPTQDRRPPVSSGDALVATDPYSASKIEAEKIVASSGLPYCTLRLAAVMPARLASAISSFSLDIVKVVFDMPLEARCEIVLDLDVAYALVGAAEDLAGAGKLAGMSGFIGGGRERGCQMRIRDMLGGIFGAVGLPLPEDSLFSPRLDSYYLDWYDTAPTQSVLGYQRHSFEDWRGDIERNYRFLKPALWLMRPAIMSWMAKKSPYLASARPD